MYWRYTTLNFLIRCNKTKTICTFNWYISHFTFIRVLLYFFKYPNIFPIFAFTLLHLLFSLKQCLLKVCYLSPWALLLLITSGVNSVVEISSSFTVSFQGTSHWILLTQAQLFGLLLLQPFYAIELLFEVRLDDIWFESSAGSLCKNVMNFRVCFSEYFIAFCVLISYTENFHLPFIVS